LAGTDIDRQLRAVNTAIKAVRATIKSNIVPADTPGLVAWRTQPDNTRPFVGSYGAACAGLAILESGLDPSDRTFLDVSAHLISTQRPSGAWTIRNAYEVDLTTATCLALRAIGNAESDLLPKRDQAIGLGIGWLKDNYSTVGWPTWPGARDVSLCATAHAIMLYSVLNGAERQVISDEIDSALNYVESQQQTDGYWLRPDRTPAIAGTALMTIALLKMGKSRKSDCLTRALDWLATQSPYQHCAGDQFYVVSPDGSVSSPIIYIHFTPALVLRALSTGWIDDPITDNDLLDELAGELTKEPTAKGYWTSPLAPLQMPTWLMNDGCAALVAYADRLKSSATPAALFNQIRLLEAKIDSLERNVAVHDTVIDSLAQGRLSKKVKRAALFTVRNWRYAALIPVAAVWLVLLFVFNANSLIVNSVGAVATVLLTAAGIVASERERGDRHHERHA
jgi:hypothetical protein